MVNQTVGGGGGSAVELEFDNIADAVSKMKGISDTIGTLESRFTAFAGGVSPDDWSSEPSCVAFGTSYKAALDVYAGVIAGMKKDLANYAAALQSAADDYETSDATAAGALAKLGAVDDGGLAQDNRGQARYHDDKHHGELSSEDPEKAQDTTPDDTSGDTRMPGAPGDNSGSGNSGSGNSGSGNSGSGNSGSGNSGSSGFTANPTTVPYAAPTTPFTSPGTSLPLGPTGAGSGGQR